MRFSTCKFETLFLSQKSVDCLLRVGEEISLQVVFQYVGVLFTRQLNKRIGAASAVIRTLHWSVVLNRAHSLNLPVDLCSSFTNGHELWVVTKRTRSEVQAAEMSFFYLGLSLRHSLRSSPIWEELGVEPLLLHVERSQLRWLRHLQ